MSDRTVVNHPWGAPLYYACPNCWHAMAHYEVSAQAKDDCPKCGQAVMRELERMNIPTPAVEAALWCLVCATFKPWGIFDPATGIAVCAECRDKARAAVSPPPADQGEGR